MKDTFTREEVINILVSMFLYAGANKNQSLNTVKGKNFGEQANTVIEANESIIGTDKSLLSVVAQFRDK